MVRCDAAFVGRYAQVNELLGEREGGNVLERARRAGKLAVCLKHPKQALDDVAQHFSSRECAVLDMQEMSMALADHSLTERQAAEQV